MKGASKAQGRRRVICTVILLLLPIPVLCGLLFSVDRRNAFAPEVLRHREQVEACAGENGIPGYRDVLLAIMTVESEGKGRDVMQSSESLGLSPNSLDTDDSIAQGAAYLAELLGTAGRMGLDGLPDGAGDAAVRQGATGGKETDASARQQATGEQGAGDAAPGGTPPLRRLLTMLPAGQAEHFPDAVVQAYNYGPGYLAFVKEHGGAHSRELAEAFARERAGGEKEDYSHAVAAERGGWRYSYGNMYYAGLVRDVWQRNREAKRMSVLSRILCTLAGTVALLFMAVECAAPGTRAASLLTGTQAADLKKKPVKRLVQMTGMADGLAGLFLLYGGLLSAHGAEVCGMVLAGILAMAAYGMLQGDRAALLIRGIIPAAAMVSLFL